MVLVMMTRQVLNGIRATQYHITISLEGWAILVLFCYRIAGNIRGAQISFFLFSVYQNENLTPEMYVMMGVFSCVNLTQQKLNTRISWR